MDVIEHEPGSWFFLEHEGQYYLDALCEKGFTSFSVAISLTDYEVGLYKSRDRDFVCELSALVQSKANSKHPRNIKEAKLLNEIREAIKQFNRCS